MIYDHRLNCVTLLSLFLSFSLCLKWNRFCLFFLFALCILYSLYFSSIFCTLYDEGREKTFAQSIKTHSQHNVLCYSIFVPFLLSWTFVFFLLSFFSWYFLPSLYERKVSQYTDIIKDSRFLVMDANMNIETMNFVLKTCHENRIPGKCSSFIFSKFSHFPSSQCKCYFFQKSFSYFFPFSPS